MAEPDFSIGQDDTGPVLEEQLFGPDGVTPLPLVGASVQFRMRPRDQSLPAVLVAANIPDAVLQPGIVQMVAWSGHTGVSGFWHYGWIATLQSGQVVTVPVRKDRLLYIKPKIV